MILSGVDVVVAVVVFDVIATASSSSIGERRVPLYVEGKVLLTGIA